MNTKETNRFKWQYIVWLAIFTFGLVRKTLQNDTFYTIKVGESIFKYGVDMLDHFSWHSNLAYTYPHWLYDCFIYLIHKCFGFAGLYGSTIVLLFILLLLVFKINIKITRSYVVSAFATFLCGLAISGFATARAQLVSFILFSLEILCIENYLQTGNKKNLIGLLIISLLICNIHPATWIFYFIIYLPYIAEYILSSIHLKIKKKNKLINKKILFEKNDRVKTLIIIMLLSTFTGLLTPIGDTPYTYSIKIYISGCQKYINEHQMMTWKNSPFTIIITLEAIILALISKAKLRDIFMILGLCIMSIVSIRHMSFLALIGTICFARIFHTFLTEYDFEIDKSLIKFFNKKIVIAISFILVITFSSLVFIHFNKDGYIDKTLYPTKAVKFIKENLDYKNIRLYNDYNYGSYLLLNDIPVFIDSRCDLYTKPFSGLDYDIFLDYEFMPSTYSEKFEFYGITHALIYKNFGIVNMLKIDDNYKIIYEDDYFIIFEKIGHSNLIVNVIPE